MVWIVAYRAWGRKEGGVSCQDEGLLEGLVVAILNSHFVSLRGNTVPPGEFLTWNYVMDYKKPHVPLLVNEHWLEWFQAEWFIRLPKLSICLVASRHHCPSRHHSPWFVWISPMKDPSHFCHTPWCGLLPVWVVDFFCLDAILMFWIVAAPLTWLWCSLEWG